MQKTLPNLFVVGAMKAGTTSLHHVLAQHPEVFMSVVKEPKYFAFLDHPGRFHGPDDPDEKRYWVDAERYASLFEPGIARRYRGESSTVYLYRPTTAEAIYRQVPDARIVILLRNPTERAYSQYNFVRQRGLEPEPNFATALALEDERVEQGWGSTWHYRRMSCYAAQVERFIDRFGKSQVFVGLHEDLTADPEQFYRQLFDFLELSIDVPLDLRTRLNRSHGVRSSTLAAVSRKLRAAIPHRIRARLWASTPWRLLVSGLRPLRWVNLRPLPPIEPDLRRRLGQAFEGDVLRLEALLGRSLDAWRARGGSW